MQCFCARCDRSCLTFCGTMDSILCPWNSPGKNTGVGCHSLLQGIFLIQKSNPGLLNCRQILYLLSYQGSLGWYKGLVRLFFLNTFSFYFEWDGLVLSGFPGDSVVKNPPAMRISGSGRSPGQGNVYPLQYCCLENSIDRGAWQATVYRVAEIQTWLSD